MAGALSPALPEAAEMLMTLAGSRGGGKSEGSREMGATEGVGGKGWAVSVLTGSAEGDGGMGRESELSSRFTYQQHRWNPCDLSGGGWTAGGGLYGGESGGDF